jgi:hypothetical protein
MNLDNKFTELKNWCIKNGSYINDKISFNPNDKKLFTNDIINSEEKILEIKQNCMITGDRILELPFMNKENSELFDDVEKLILVLCYNIFIKEESFFKEYIEILPNMESFKNHPISILRSMIKDPNYATNDDILLVLGSYANTINEINDKLNLLYEKITNINCIYKKILNKDVLLYGFLLVKTRSLDNKALVPIIDLVSYSNKSNLNLDINNEHYLFKSINEYQSNSIINYNYDKKSNLEFYFHYNFIPENNTHKLSINISNDKIKELFAQKIDGLAIDYKEIQPDLLALCRIQSLSTCELDQIYESKNTEIVYNYINLENELCAYKLLLNVFANCKKDIEPKVKISSKLKDDKNLLLQNFSKIFLDLNDAINKSILRILFLWNTQLNSPIKYNIILE